MSTYQSEESIKFEKAGCYQIVVQGFIDEDRSDILSGMSITHSPRESGTSRTILKGHLRDQTQLSGILNSLYEWHLPILLVEFIKDNDEARA